MKRYLLLISFILFFCLPTYSQTTLRKYQGYAERGGKSVQVSPTIIYKVQESYPSATVTVYLTGTTTLASIYSNSTGSVKSNPFTANSDGYYDFYIKSGRYDIKLSDGGIVTPFTLSDIKIDDLSPYSPINYGAKCDSSSAGGGTDDTTAFTSMLTDIGSRISTITLPQGVCKISSLSFPRNTHLDFESAGAFYIVTGQTVSILGTFTPDLRRQRFYNATSGQGTVSFLNNIVAPEFLPEWWGAIADAVTVNTAPIQATINAKSTMNGGKIKFGTGTYITGSLLVSTNHIRLYGEGQSSRLAMNSATGDTISFDNGIIANINLEQANMLAGSGIEDVKLEPAIARTSGAEISAYYYNKIYLNNLTIQNVYTGMILGRSGNNQNITAYINNLRLRQYKFGIKAVNAIEVWGTNWSLDKYDQTDNTYSIWLSGHISGFNLENFDIVNSKYSEVGAGPTANNVYAMYVHNDTGITTDKVLACYFTNGYFDSHTRGVFADYGSGMFFTNVEFSALSTFFNPSTGVTLTADVDTYNFNNCHFINNGGVGIYVGGTNNNVSITSSEFSGNNKQGFPDTDAFSSGVWLDGGHITITNCYSGNNPIFPGNLQQYAVWINNTPGIKFTISNNNFLNNTNAKIVNNLAGVGIDRRINNNLGYVTESSGISNIPSGNTTITIVHGLTPIPNPENFIIKPKNITTNPITFAVTATTATTFTVTLSGNPGASGFSFGWDGAYR